MCTPHQGGTAQGGLTGLLAKAPDPLHLSNGGGGLDPLNLAGYNVDPAAQAAADAEAKRQRQIAAGMTSINKTFNSPQRQQQYADYYANTLKALTGNLDYSQKLAGQQLKFANARQGLTGGSAAADEQGVLARDYLQGRQGAVSQAEQGKESLMSADQAAKERLQQLLLSGADPTTATGNAASDALINIRNAQAGIAPGAMDQYFGNLADYYDTSQLIDAQRKAMSTLAQYFQNAPAPGSGSGGVPFL